MYILTHEEEDIMKEVKYVDAEYVAYDILEVEGKWKNVKPYLKQGYINTKLVERNGYWILERKCRVDVVLWNEDISQMYKFNLHKELHRFYKEPVITQEVFDKFKRDALTGKIKFYLNGSFLTII